MRRRVSGVDAVTRALSEARSGGGEPVRCVVVSEGELPEPLESLCAEARAVGAEVVRAGDRRGRRLLGSQSVAALLGEAVDADLDDAMARGGAVWLLVGTSYAGNVGAAIRTAEVSGADAVYVHNDFDHGQRREARRASMRADRFLPVAWERAGAVIGAARRAGKTVIGVEDSGDVPPWQAPLHGSVLLLVGGEADGLPAALLRRCDHVVRIPMSGFVTSYNLQAAVAALAVERLRQREGLAR